MIMGIIAQGVRVYANADGWLDPAEINQAARYGRATNESASERIRWWEVTAPDGSTGSINPDIHTVTEHEDGTITLSPSLDFSARRPGAWHGWLRRGVFESV